MRASARKSGIIANFVRAHPDRRDGCPDVPGLYSAMVITAGGGAPVGVVIEVVAIPELHPDRTDPPFVVYAHVPRMWWPIRHTAVIAHAPFVGLRPIGQHFEGPYDPDWKGK